MADPEPDRRAAQMNQQDGRASMTISKRARFPGRRSRSAPRWWCRRRSGSAAGSGCRTRPKGRMIDVTGLGQEADRLRSDRVDGDRSRRRILDRTVAAKALARTRQDARSPTWPSKGSRRTRSRAAGRQRRGGQGDGVHRDGRSAHREDGVQGLQDQPADHGAVNRRGARRADLARDHAVARDAACPCRRRIRRYFYSKLGELKIEMLAAAARDARVRATAILAQTRGGSVARLRSARHGRHQRKPGEFHGNLLGGQQRHVVARQGHHHDRPRHLRAGMKAIFPCPSGIPPPGSRF